MTLEVPYETFADAAKRLVGAKEAFLAAETSGTRISAADPAKGVRVVSFANVSADVVKATLAESGITAFEGRWVPDDAPELQGEAYVAAIAYKTDAGQPGLWVDAFPSMPSHVHVIRVMYDEFREQGEISEVSFEEFSRLAEPTVVILSPSQIHSFATDKGC